VTYLVQATKRLLSLIWLWMYTQPNNDTLHAKSLVGVSLTGGSLTGKTEKGPNASLSDDYATMGSGFRGVRNHVHTSAELPSDGLNASLVGEYS
jgi:hypothetical protein